MPREVYNSSTLGRIPLSFTGRHLLQALRDEVADMVAAVKKGVNIDARNWEPVSRARGRIAQYMSELEEKRSVIEVVLAPTSVLTDELCKRGYAVLKGPAISDTPPPMDSLRIHINNLARPFDLRKSKVRCPVDFSKEMNFGGVEKEKLAPGSPRAIRLWHWRQMLECDRAERSKTASPAYKERMHANARVHMQAVNLLNESCAGTVEEDNRTCVL